MREYNPRAPEGVTSGHTPRSTEWKLGDWRSKSHTPARRSLQRVLRCNSDDELLRRMQHEDVEVGRRSNISSTRRGRYISTTQFAKLVRISRVRIWRHRTALAVAACPHLFQLFNVSPRPSVQHSVKFSSKFLTNSCLSELSPEAAFELLTSHWKPFERM